MRKIFKALVLASVAICALNAKARTQDDQNKFLRLDDAIRYTLERNPQLASHRFRLKALQGEQQTAELKPQMRASAHVENVAGSGDYNGINAGELTLSLSSVIEASEQRDARLGLVTARQAQLNSQQRLLTVDVLTQLTQQFIRLAATQEKLKLLRQTEQFSSKNVDTINHHVKIGRISDVELLRAKASLTKASLSEKKVQQEFISEQLKLSAFWAEEQPDFQNVQSDFFKLPALPSVARLVDQLNKNPDLAVLGDEVYLRAAELRQAQAERKTNLEWSAGIRQLRASNDSAVVVGLSVPLGSAARASGAIATANAHRDHAEQKLSAERIKLQAQLKSLHASYENAVLEVQSLRDEVLPLLQRALSKTSDAFKSGRYSYFELNVAQRDLLETQLALVEATANAHILHTEIERLTGSVFASEQLSNSASQVQP